MGETRVAESTYTVKMEESRTSGTLLNLVVKYDHKTNSGSFDIEFLYAAPKNFDRNLMRLGLDRIYSGIYKNVQWYNVRIPEDENSPRDDARVEKLMRDLSAIIDINGFQPPVAFKIFREMEVLTEDLTGHQCWLSEGANMANRISTQLH